MKKQNKKKMTTRKRLTWLVDCVLVCTNGTRRERRVERGEKNEARGRQNRPREQDAVDEKTDPQRCAWSARLQFVVHEYGPDPQASKAAW